MTDILPVRPEKTHLLSNKAYDVLKFIALILLPALGTLYFTLAGIWGLPAAEQVIGTIAAVDVFLGLLIKIGDASYAKSGAKFAGSLDVSETPRGRTFLLNLDGDPEKAVKENEELTFRVNLPDRKPPPYVEGSERIGRP